MKKIILALSCWLFSSLNPAVAEEANASFLNFRFAPLVAFGNRSYDVSSVVSWNPEYKWNDTFGIGWNVGYSILKKRPRPSFNVWEYSVSGSYAFHPSWTAELLLGAQTWAVSEGGTAFFVGTNGKYTLAEKWLGYIDGFFAGYSLVTQRVAFHIVRVGATFQF